MKLLGILTALATLALATVSWASDSDVALKGCPPGLLASLEPRTDGPYLRLEQVTCVQFRSVEGDALLSPDGSAIVHWQRGSPATIEAVSMEGDSLISLPNRVTFRQLGSELSYGVPEAMQWARDSRSLLTIQQLTTPSGWASSGLKPTRVSLDGGVEVLHVSHPAGPLDGLQWIGRDGLALALFGARGSYYRPEHVDRSPTLAIIDTANGDIRATFRLADDPDLAVRLQRSATLAIPAFATATVLPDGRVRAVLQYQPWRDRKLLSSAADDEGVQQPAHRLVWTEGEEPVPFSGTEGVGRIGPVVITPEGSGLLVAKSVQPDGIQIFDCRGCPPPPPPIPVTAVLAERVDVTSGQTIWRLEATATNFWSQRTGPSLSADGRHALLEMPSQDGRSMIALVSMANGAVLQSFSAVSVGSYKQNFGFLPDGRGVWLECGGMVFRYRLRLPNP